MLVPKQMHQPFLPVGQAEDRRGSRWMQCWIVGLGEGGGLGLFSMVRPDPISNMGYPLRNNWAMYKC